MLLEVCCALSVARCRLCVSPRCCMSPVARCMSFAVRCILPIAWRMLSRCCLSRCMSSVAYSPLHVASRLFSVAHFPVVPCTLPLACRLRHCCWLDRVCCTLSVVFFPVARPSAPCRVVCAACRQAHVASRLVHVLRVVGCILHDARSQSHRVSCVSPAPSCMPSVACCKTRVLCCFLSLVHADPILACRLLHVVGCNVAERHSAVAHAAHRGGASQLSASVAGKTRYRPRCACVRACVCACVHVCVHACAWVASVWCVVVGCCACVGSICATAIE